MQILIYHGKHGDEYWLADTPEQQHAAKRKLFEMFDEWGCFEDEPESIALESARNGDAFFIGQFVESQKGYEYGDWDIEEVSDPCD
jgi:hypothetical protein